MYRPLWLGPCLALALSGCFISTPHTQAQKNVNTALTAACIAALQTPCIIEPSAAEKSQATEARAAAVRTQAQRDSVAADEDAARRSSCLTDTGPRLPVTASQCAAYVTVSSNPK